VLHRIDIRYTRNLNTILVGLISAILISSCEEEVNKRLPEVETYEVWNISQKTAKAGGYVITDGGLPLSARGVCWNTDTLPTISNKHTTESGDRGEFESTLNGLMPATVYYVRAYATNRNGTGYGNQVSFVAGPVREPDVGTVQVSSITNISAISGGVIGYDGGDSVTAKGVCWDTSTGPTTENFHTMDGGGDDDYVSELTGLSGNTTYYVKAYATNSAGTAYGSELSFTTMTDSAAIVLFSPILFNHSLTYGTVTDPDYNEYKTIQIGTQTWMAENLKTTTFSSGNQIANITESTMWPDYTLDAFNWYDSDISFKANYGALYNWYAVNTGLLCPDGWHIPSKAEIETLITYLGGESVAGRKLKESSTDHWLLPNTEADNESGFTALPGGYLFNGEYESFRVAGYWWSSTGGSSEEAYYLAIPGNDDTAGTDAAAKTSGMSVRCIED
jgi:uncharacterized protein (TIGR02145 family)